MVEVRNSGISPDFKEGRQPALNVYGGVFYGELLGNPLAEMKTLDKELIIT